MNAVDVARTLVENAPDALLVSSLGTATSALRRASNDGPHLYFGGAMGCTAATALGIADALPERDVIALVGDGELLMGASTLWSISALAPSNLLLVTLLDGHYSITGGSQSPQRRGSSKWHRACVISPRLVRAQPMSWLRSCQRFLVRGCSRRTSKSCARRLGS